MYIKLNILDLKMKRYMYMYVCYEMEDFSTTFVKLMTNHQAIVAISY